jgi:hypothetical protein
MFHKRIGLFFCASALALAGTVTFGTGVGLLEGNDLTGVNVATIPASVFHAPTGTSVWESTQADSTNPPIPNGTTVNFYFGFILAGLPLAGTVNILVDDSARGWLNGNLLFDNLGSPQGPNCAASLPNCLTPLTVNLAPFLLPGANMLTVLVSQDGRAQFAIDAYGSASFQDGGAPPPAPRSEAAEPLTTLLIGSGLLVIARKQFPWSHV